MGAFVNYFFSGFILGKIPFALSPKFRMMLQRGIDLPSLDVSYFTSLSYYILLLFGLRGVMMLVFRDEAISDAEMMQRMQAQVGAVSVCFGGWNGGVGLRGVQAEERMQVQEGPAMALEERGKGWCSWR